jgi:hypothetical protein
VTGAEKGRKNKEQRAGIGENIWGILAGRRKFDMLVTPFAEKV